MLNSERKVEIGEFAGIASRMWINYSTQVALHSRAGVHQSVMLVLDW